MIPFCKIWSFILRSATMGLHFDGFVRFEKTINQYNSMKKKPNKFDKTRPISQSNLGLIVVIVINSFLFLTAGYKYKAYLVCYQPRSCDNAKTSPDTSWYIYLLGM